MGKSPQGQASTHAEQVNARMAQQAYGLGTDTLGKFYNRIDFGLQSNRLGAAYGEDTQFPWMAQGWDAQRTELKEGLANQQRTAIQQRAGQAGAAAAGGNFSLNITPEQFGSMMAKNAVSSKVSQGMQQVEEFNKLTGMGLGASVETGSQAARAGAQQLQAIGMMPKVNPYYEAILGVANTAGAIYGGLNQPTSYGMYTNNGSQWYGADPNSTGTILSSFGAR